MEVGAALLLALLALLSFAVLMALLHTSRAWLYELAAAIHNIHIPFLGAIPGVDAIASWIAHNLTSGAKATIQFVEHTLSHTLIHYLKPAALWFTGVGQFYDQLSAVIGDFGQAVEWGFGRVKHHEIPRQVGRATKPLSARTKKAAAAAGAALAGSLALRRRLHSHVEPQLKHLTHQTTVALPRSIAHERDRARTRERSLEHEITHPSVRWLRRIAVAMWFLVMAGLVAKVLTRIFPWRNCNSFKNLSRKLKCSHFKFLDDLLFGALALFAVVDPVPIAKAAILTEEKLHSLVVGMTHPSKAVTTATEDAMSLLTAALNLPSFIP